MTQPVWVMTLERLAAHHTENLLRKFLSGMAARSCFLLMLLVLEAPSLLLRTHAQEMAAINPGEANLFVGFNGYGLYVSNQGPALLEVTVKEAATSQVSPGEFPRNPGRK